MRAWLHAIGFGVLMWIRLDTRRSASALFLTFSRSSDMRLIYRRPKNFGPFQRVPVIAKAAFDRLG